MQNAILCLNLKYFWSVLRFTISIRKRISKNCLKINFERQISLMGYTYLIKSVPMYAKIGSVQKTKILVDVYFYKY